MFFTGITPMAFADAFSGLNMVKDITDHPDFYLLLGFTDKDVQHALCQTGINGSDLQQHPTKMRIHFNGYRFNANQVDGIYNAQACLYYLCAIAKTGKAPDENISSPPDNVVEFLIRMFESSKNVGMAMTWKEMIFGLVTEKLNTNIRSADLLMPYNRERALLSLAYYHGYLTHAAQTPQEVDNAEHLSSLKYPDLDEMQRVILARLTLDYSKQFYPVINDILDAEEKRDKERRELIIQQELKSLLKVIGIYDVKVK
jgi:hypothetical protein